MAEEEEQEFQLTESQMNGKLDANIIKIINK